MDEPPGRPLVVGPAESMLPNQSIVTPPPPTHHLSAADDLITRFQLHDSYRVLLHPFRKDIRSPDRAKDTAQQPSTSAAAASAAAPTTPIGTPATPARASPAPGPSNVAHPSNNTGALLPRTFAHFLEPSLPGKVNPQKPPRKHQVLARKAAQQSLMGQEEGAGGAAAPDGSSPNSAAANNKERQLARAQAHWEKISTTLRRTVMKPEYTPADIRPLDDEALRGYTVEAGEVPEIDRSLLEADAPPGSTPPRKKKKKTHRPGMAPASGPT